MGRKGTISKNILKKSRPFSNSDIGSNLNPGFSILPLVKNRDVHIPKIGTGSLIVSKVKSK